MCFEEQKLSRIQLQCAKPEFVSEHNSISTIRSASNTNIQCCVHLTLTVPNGLFQLSRWEGAKCS